MSGRSYGDILLLAVFLLPGITISGQFRNGKVIDERSGLSDVRVHAMAKDRYGFMWIGTQRGLNRFDGSQVRQFFHDPVDSLSLMHNEVLAMTVDSQKLWVGGLYGISSVDLTDYTVRNIRFDCDGLVRKPEDKYLHAPHVSFIHLEDGILWISTRECGLIRFDPRTEDFKRISFASHRREIPEMISSVALDLIIGFAEDPLQDSIFWIGTGSGLIRLNHRTGTHSLYYHRQDDLLYQDAMNTFRRILFHNGLIYYLTWGWGVQVFDPGKEIFYPLPIEGTVGKDLRHNVVSVYPYDEYNLWIRTIEGLYLYNTTFRRCINFYPNEDDSAIYLGVDYHDETNRRWIATDKGVYLYDPLYEQFLTFSYAHLNEPDWYGFARKVIQHPDGQVITILGQAVDGLYHFSHLENTWFETPIPGYPTKDGEGFYGVDLAIEEKYGWVFSGLEGIYFFDPVAYRVREIDLNIDLRRKQYADLEWDGAGFLCIGTRHEGLLRWDPRTGHTRQYKKEIYGEDLVTTRPSASGLFRDSRGNIWFATGNGHAVFDIAADTLYSFSYSRQNTHTLPDIARFTEDRHGTIWAVTHKGILLTGNVTLPAKGLTIEKSVFESGVSPSYVEGIVYGYDKKLYVLCENALIRIDSTRELSHFSFDYASYIGDFYSFDTLSEASLIVGLRNGFTVLHSTGLQRNTELPAPYLTGITINEKPLTGNFISSAPALSLKHNENFVSFSFSAISYTLPEKNTFRYRLNGFDQEWINAGDRRFANYTNIPSGEYAFELQVANNEGIWNPDIYTATLQIARPWWATWLFRISAFFCLVTGGILAYRYRVAQIRKETRLKAEFERKIGDVELSALKAQMNPHFIFNCLNSIENYILKNESMKAAEYINDFARLIRLILQNSRSQYIPLKDEIEALDLYLQMESLRFDNKFEYHIDVSPEIELSETDIPPMLIQPFVENAIWHGLIPKNAPGKLDIGISRQNGELHCVIHDNGIGRERSREVNASMHKRGKKSMGMLITKNRIDVFNELYQTNATVHIHDLKDDDGNPAGTRVELNIPVE